MNSVKNSSLMHRRYLAPNKQNFDLFQTINMTSKTAKQLENEIKELEVI